MTSPNNGCEGDYHSAVISLFHLWFELTSFLMFGVVNICLNDLVLMMFFYKPAFFILVKAAIKM